MMNADEIVKKKLHKTALRIQSKKRFWIFFAKFKKKEYHPRKLLEYPGSSMQNLGDPEQDTKGSPL